MNVTKYLSVAALAALASVAVVAAPASAHTPTVGADCATVSVELVSYTTTQNDAAPNSITVRIDGDLIAQETFGTSISRYYDFDDSAVAHDWAVHVDSIDDNYDRDFGGTTTPCTPPPVVDATAAVTTAAATCDLGETLTLGAITAADWGTPTRTTGPGDYEVTATAHQGHLFAGDQPTLTLRDTLAGPLTGEDCDDEPVPPVTPVKPEPESTTKFSESVDCQTDTITRVTTTTTTDVVFDAQENEWVETEPAIVVASATRPADVTACPATVVTTETPGGSLAVTGADPAPFLWLAGILATVGTALLVRQRRRSA
jgi:hypothetical protein